MALKHYDMEGGTEGATVTAPLSGAQLISNPNSEGTIKFMAAAKNSGSFGIRAAAASTNDITTRWGLLAPNYQVSFAFNIRFTVLPAAQKLLATLRNASGTAWRLSLRQDGTLHTDGSVVTGDTAVGVTLSTNTWYRIEVLADVIASTGKVRVYKGNSLTLLASLNQEGMNLGSTQIAAADIYGNRSQTTDIDDVRVNDGSTAWLGPARPTLEPSSTVRPWDMVDNSGDYSVVGTTNFTTAVADDSDTTYVESINSPVNTPIMFALNPLTLGPVTVNLRHSATSASPVITRTIRLLQGSTLIAQRATTLPTSITSYSFTTTNSETNLLEWPRDNLYLEIRDSAL
ncbi:hypothetical protein DFO58_2215 [Arthrobacter sp. AG1021]|uniref:hypothetical protein n=1 Tax=Arthrobacter sp. AG1021 TaxID=2183908 RepID=UPI000EAC4C91|nr:hypothetical protein [Arthrobacter sp. AG1021]RKS19710.1 hypothetical protein DFO58_2215 [Arthrobacter sp. AG1021]